MLIDIKLADTFLHNYKAIIYFLNNGVEPENLETYATLRSSIFQSIDSIEKEMSGIIDRDFIRSLRSSIYGKFIYLKKYQKGYVFQNIDTQKYYQVIALTTPLEEIIDQYCVINTAIIPYSSKLVCDGLFLSNGVYIGKNMAKEIRDGYWQAKRNGKLITNA